MFDRQLMLATHSTEDLKREMTQEWRRLTAELDDIEARIIELEMTMASYGIGSLADEAPQTMH